MAVRGVDGLKPTTPEYIRKKWPEKTKPVQCWFGCGTLIYFDRNVVSKSWRRIKMRVSDNGKHHCPLDPESPEFNPNHPLYIKPTTNTIDFK